MKTLAFLLLLMNIGFYVWLQGMLPWLPWQPEQYESKSQTVQLSMDVERLVLVEERDAPPAETIVRLADSEGILDEPRTLQDEAKITTDEADLFKTENLTLAEVEQEPSNNVSSMSVVSKIAQLPTQEQAENIVDDTKDDDVQTAIEKESTEKKPIDAQPTTDDEDPKPTIEEPNESVNTLAVNNVDNEQKSPIIKQPIQSDNVQASDDSPVEESDETPITYEQAESSGQQSEEQQADNFFARLAQTVERVGNTFKRVSSDVFNERVTVPPEFEKPQPPEEKPKPVSIAAAPEPVKKVEKPVELICYEIGAYTSISQLNKHANWLKLQSKSIKTFIDKKTVKEVDKVRVYIAPNPRVPLSQQRLIAQNIVMRLRHDGVRDMYLLSGGTLKNSISLGVFDNYANAQRRANAIKAKSYANVQLKNYYKQQKQYWLIAKMPQTQQIIASKFQKTFKKMRLDKMQHCQ
jgi:hypothetical protein